jgi:branched-chain amino acid transport system permease protein
MLLETAQHWIAAHQAFVDAAGIDALLGLSAWIVLACGKISFGNGALAALGAIGALFVEHRYHASLALAIPAGAVFAGATGYVAGAILARASRAQTSVATLCFGQLAAIALRTGPAGAPPHAAGTAAIYFVLALATFALWRLLRSREGTALRASASDPVAADAIGIDPARSTRIAFASAGLIAGAAGALLSFQGNAADIIAGGPLRSLDALAVAVLGGSANLYGPFVGAALIDGIGAAFPKAAHFHYLIDAGALLGCALVLPGGLASIASLFHLRSGPAAAV